MVVKDVEREDIEHVCKSLGCGPIASLDHFTADKLASAELVEEVQTGSSKTVRVTGIAKQVGTNVKIFKIHVFCSNCSQHCNFLQ
jgi:T-complex protein 1 subunit delta